MKTPNLLNSERDLAVKHGASDEETQTETDRHTLWEHTLPHTAGITMM